MKTPPIQEAYNKGLNTIESCISEEQLEVASNYVDLFLRCYVRPVDAELDGIPLYKNLILSLKRKKW